MLLLITFCFLGLQAADQCSIATLTVAQRKDLLFEYMLNKGFANEMIPYIKPYNIVGRVELLQALNRLYKPGGEAYELTKMTCRNIFRMVEQASPDNKESMIRLYVEYNIAPMVRDNPYCAQKTFEMITASEESVKAPFVSGIKDLLNLCYLQQALEIPSIEDQEFDELYKKKMSEALKSLQDAAFFKTAFEVEEPQAIKELLSKNDLNSAQIDGFVAIAFDETRKILNTHQKQDDPYCGI